MPLLPDQLDDFVTTTLRLYRRDNWVDISLGYQNYCFAERIQGQANRSQLERGGQQLDWKVQVNNTGTARHSELFDVDVTAVKDLMVTANVEWTKQTVNFSYDIDESAFQSDRERLIDEISIRRHSMFNDYFDLMETAMWTAPTSTTQSPRIPYGIPFWVVKDATTTPAGGFEGGNPSGFTSGAAGISSSTYSNWDNWAYGYTSMTRDDGIERWRKACEFTNFRPPNNYPQLKWSNKPFDYGHYTTWTVQTTLEKYLQQSNDNLGVDIARYMGEVLMKGAPVKWVTYLDTNDSADPVYTINWNDMHYFYQKGRNMKIWPPEPAPGQHTVRRVNMDNWGNFACYNRRTQAVGSTS